MSLKVGLYDALTVGAVMRHSALSTGLPMRAKSHAAAKLWARSTVPAQVGAPVGERHGGQEAVHRPEEARLADVDRFGRRRSGVTQEGGPGEVGGKRVGCGERELVVVGVGVAPLDTGERDAR